MKKYRRIKKSDEFQVMIRSKRFVTTPSLVLYYIDRKEDTSRVGITVSKKIGNAVVRNLCKRQIRMMASEIMDKNDDLDYIIMARASYLKNSFLDNRKQLENLHKKVKIRKNKGEYK